jgi:hypothetical protein
MIVFVLGALVSVCPVVPLDVMPAVVEQAGKVKGVARRAMTPALAIRFTLLMTLMPDADYPEVMAALLGDLAAMPWQRPY